MTTSSLKAKDISRKWYVLDASEAPLGRLATRASRLLLGKDKPSQTPGMDNGDFVVVINSQNLIVSGNKLADKIYYRHSGFPGGLHQKRLDEIVEKDSESIIRHAISGMLPDNKLRKARLERLKVYRSTEHPHKAQNPEVLKLEVKDR